MLVMAESTKLKLRHISLTTVKLGDKFIVTGQQNLTAFKQHVRCLPSTREH